MPDKPKRPGDESDAAGEEPAAHQIPEPPQLNPVLPAHPERAKPAQSGGDGGGYVRAMMAVNAVTSFVAPIVLLCLGGYWLDHKLKLTTPWFAMAGVILGLSVGISSLMRVLNKLSK